jgi:chromosome segregation ATPase
LEEDFNRQAEAIAKALLAVNELTGYLERQQAEVKERNRIIASLKEEEGKIRPLVQADRATVSAILEAEARQRRQEIWLERGLSFVLGVISSLFATWLWKLMHRPSSTIPPA